METYSELARTAEESGWDGFFLWDHLIEWDRRVTLFDSLTVLAAIAVRTERIRIGTIVTPVPRYPPWELARRVATLDHLSKGRMTLGVGLGGEESVDYGRFEGSPDPAVLAEKLDESLEIISGLWRGKRFSFKGKHYSIKEPTQFLPKPVQRPRVPLWVGGLWPNRGPFRRAARWDGAVPIARSGSLLSPERLERVADFLRTRGARVGEGYEVVNIGSTTSRGNVSKYVSAGMTWWIESLYESRNRPKEMLDRIRIGPPR